MRIFARNFGTNYRSKRIFARNFGTNCRSKRIFARNFGTNCRSKRIFARNFGTNCRSKRIFVRKFASTTTIGIAKIRRMFCELSRWTKIRHFSSKSPEIRAFRRITFSLLFHNTVHFGVGGVRPVHHLRSTTPGKSYTFFS